MGNITWEEAVDWLRNQPDQQELVRDCYYDDPLIEAAVRFAASDEWQAVQKFLPEVHGTALDLGAGRGISSYALARAGWQVTALEPDPSALVGAEAIRSLSKQSGLNIQVCETYGETLPFDDGSFNLVYGRQVLHHAQDLQAFCREMARVLKPGGRFIATREHVISKPEDLDVFLDNHPLHKLYGGENAYQLREYTDALRLGGLNLLYALGHLESVINYFPATHAQAQSACRAPLARVTGKRLAKLIASDRHIVGRWLLAHLATWVSNRNKTPGRLYSFIGEKPE